MNYFNHVIVSRHETVYSASELPYSFQTSKKCFVQHLRDATFDFKAPLVFFRGTWYNLTEPNDQTNEVLEFFAYQLYYKLNSGNLEIRCFSIARYVDWQSIVKSLSIQSQIPEE